MNFFHFNEIPTLLLAYSSTQPLSSVTELSCQKAISDTTGMYTNTQNYYNEFIYKVHNYMYMIICLIVKKYLMMRGLSVVLVQI